MQLIIYLFIYLAKGSLFVKCQRGPWYNRTGRPASQGLGTFRQMCWSERIPYQSSVSTWAVLRTRDTGSKTG